MKDAWCWHEHNLFSSDPIFPASWHVVMLKRYRRALQKLFEGLESKIVSELLHHTCGAVVYNSPPPSPFLTKVVLLQLAGIVSTARLAHIRVFADGVLSFPHAQHNWQVQGGRILFQVEGKAGKAEGLPPLALINNALMYAKELERIV
eukprot:461213-Pelagomonas_calceolata.AAC.3